LLNKKNINYSFTAYGDGELGQELEHFGKIEGFINDIENKIKAADIIFTSSYLTMLQVLAARKIVISVFENKLKEDYLKNSPFAKYIYICKSGEEIYSVIQSIAVESWKTNSMVENGFKWAVGQTWGNVTEKYLKLWKK
jgi:hypothetical protein